MSSELTNPPTLLFALKNLLAVVEGKGAVAPAKDIARAAIAAAEADAHAQGTPPADFCDAHCTWLDHHPACERAEQAAAMGVSQ